MCGKTFNFETAFVVCKEFGLKSLRYDDSSMPGPPGGRIWLERVLCIGNESSIFDCPHSEWGNIRDCTHKNDVYITCAGT